MSVGRRISKNSLTYITANFLEKGAAFFLIPIYTRILTPFDYGIIAVVTVVGNFLEIFFSLGLRSSVIRFYFDYKDRPEELKNFWGTILSFIILFSVLSGTLISIFGKPFIQPILKEVQFFPYMFLGIVSVVFTPLFMIYLSILQVQEKAAKFSCLSVIRSLLRISIIIALIVGLKMGAVGFLIANSITALIFFIMTLWLIRNEIKISMNMKYLKQGICYSLPLLPHNLSKIFKSMIDRIFINNLINTGSVGIYNVGYQFGNILNIITNSTNRAFLPAFMDAMKVKNDKILNELNQTAILMVFFYFMIAAFIAVFSKEVMLFFVGKSFTSGHIIVPFIAFSFAVNGVYMIFINVFFYEKTITKYIPVMTVTGALLNIILNLFLIKEMGIVGAALANFLSQLVITTIVAYVGFRLTSIHWSYFKILFVVTFTFCSTMGIIKFVHFDLFPDLVLKILFVFLLAVALNVAVWRDPLFTFRKICVHGARLFQRRRSVS